MEESYPVTKYSTYSRGEPSSDSNCNSQTQRLLLALITKNEVDTYISVLYNDTDLPSFSKAWVSSYVHYYYGDVNKVKKNN